MRILAHNMSIAFLALSLLGGWTVQATMACGGPCCAVPAAQAEMPSRAAPMAMGMQGCCCCGGEQAPCDLERAPLPDAQPRALSAVPKIELPSCALGKASVASASNLSAESGTRHWGSDPPGLPPPTPLYLKNDSFLC